MRKRDFDIVFSGLSLGEHQFVFELNDAFFDLFGYTDHSKLLARATVDFHKHNTFLELVFSLTGEIEVICDRSGEPFQQHLENKFQLVVKFGDAYDDSDDETLIVTQGEYQINVAQYLYELVVLAIPAKNIHPELSRKKKTSSKKVDEKELQKEEKIDPRWDKLKDLLN